MYRQDWNRLALVTVLAEKMQERGGGLGRTRLMKFAYLLQTVKNVPLGYNFTLYSYGPFDSSVLGDLSYASVLQAVNENAINNGVKRREEMSHYAPLRIEPPRPLGEIIVPAQGLRPGSVWFSR